MTRKVNDFDGVEIVDGKMQGLTLSYHFNVRLSEDCNPGVCPNVNCDGMPVSVLCKKAWDAMKVSARPSMKKLSEKDMLKAYHGQEVSWRVMVSQEAAGSMMQNIALSDTELDAQIAKLMALKEDRSNDENENDENTDI